MRTEKISYFTEKEEEFAHLLTKIGIPKNIAAVLVFLANVPESTSRAVEKGTDLRQPEISLAMKYLVDEGWVASRKYKTVGKGRPMKIYKLKRPLSEILDILEKEIRTDVSGTVTKIQKLKKSV